MEPNSPAEDLPALYRAILDRVAELEAVGHRELAADVRRDATHAYSRAWDDRARRQLEALLRRATRASAPERATPRGQRRPFGRRHATTARHVIAPER